MRKLFVTGIGTGVGKTIVSAVLVESLKADYWKPVQAGLEGKTDSEVIRELVSHPDLKIHPETNRLKTPMSPHAAARRDGITIDPQRFVVPAGKSALVIEGAGGLMVPLTDDFLVIDLIAQLQAEAVLVVRHYLGSINHTLLSAEALKSTRIPVLGIVWCGEKHEESESVIQHRLNWPVLGRIGQEERFDREKVRKYSQKFQTV